MGQSIIPIAQERGHSVIASFNRSRPPSLLQIRESGGCMGFFHASSVLPHLKLALQAGKPMVIGTTGWDSQLPYAQQLVSESSSAAVYSPNFSVGIALFLNLLSHASSLFASHTNYDAASVEYHHREKKDTPSGTAKAISEIFGKELPTTSVRCGHIPGTHSVLFDSTVDTITLTHQARSREGFAQGALQGAEWIINKKGWWTFHDLVRSLYTNHHSI